MLVKSKPKFFTVLSYTLVPLMFLVLMFFMGLGYFTFLTDSYLPLSLFELLEGSGSWKELIDELQALQRDPSGMTNLSVGSVLVILYYMVVHPLLKPDRRFSQIIILVSALIAFMLLLFVHPLVFESRHGFLKELPRYTTFSLAWWVAISLSTYAFSAFFLGFIKITSIVLAQPVRVHINHESIAFFSFYLRPVRTFYFDQLDGYVEVENTDWRRHFVFKSSIMLVQNGQVPYVREFQIKRRFGFHDIECRNFDELASALPLKHLGQYKIDHPFVSLY